MSIENGSRRILQWWDSGDLKDNWIIGCINLLADENTTVIFTAIRGNGPLGDIAIDDVSVKPGFCPRKLFHPPEHYKAIDKISRN